MRGIAAHAESAFVHRYVLEDVETNNERYLLDAHIATGPLVAELLDQSA
jgi:hypothetical protein